MDNEESGINKSDFEGSGIFSYLGQEKGSPNRPSRVPRALAIAASIVIVLAGIQAANIIVGPMLLALFFAVILLVPLRWLQKHGCPQLLAFLFVLICTVTLFVGITYFVSQSLTNFIVTIPGYKNRFVEKYAEFEKQLEEWGFVLGELKEKILTGEKEPTGEHQSDEPTPVSEQIPIEIPTAPPAAIPDFVMTDDAVDQDDAVSFLDEDGEKEKTAQSDDEIPSVPFEEVVRLVKEMEEKEPSFIALDPSVIALWIARALIYLRSMLEGGFLVLLFTIFMLFEASFFPAKVERAFGKDGPLNIGHFHRIADDIRRYLFLKTLANLMSGSAAMFVYYMFGIEAWFFWGIVAFIMYYIPNIGGTLAAVIPGMLILMTHGLPMTLLYALCLVAIECSIAYGIEPRILGHGLRLSTLVIILSLFFWGFLLGAIGLFLAAPLTVMIKIVLQAFPETRWLAIFLDGGRHDKQY